MGKEQHFTDGSNLDQDLRDNPGIGQSKGTTVSGEQPVEGENTVEGDVENDAGPNGEVSRRPFRTNE
jgi:hypothetical protein